MISAASVADWIEKSVASMLPDLVSISEPHVWKTSLFAKRQSLTCFTVFLCAYSAPAPGI